MAAITDEAVKIALRDWHTSKDEANRYNRNLLQYAAALAALLGISGGSGAVAAVGISVSKLDGDDALWILILAGVVGLIVAIIAAVLIRYLICAFRQRSKAEKQENVSLRELIGLIPDRFLPSKPAEE